MNRKYFLLTVSFIIVIITAYSCGGSDDSTSTVSQEWIDFQGDVYKDMSDSLPEFTKLQCLTNNGYLYYKDIHSFTSIGESSTQEKRTKISSDGYPTFGDSVQCRYLGWFYSKNTDGTRTKIYFDGTETSPPDYSFNKESGVLFNINNSLTSGFLTMLQYMKAGQQVRVCIPYQLAYGISGSTSIPGYTTLFFDIYLMRIYPKNPDQYPNIDLGENNH